MDALLSMFANPDKIHSVDTSVDCGGKNQSDNNDDDIQAMSVNTNQQNREVSKSPQHQDRVNTPPMPCQEHARYTSSPILDRATTSSPVSIQHHHHHHHHHPHHQRHVTSPSHQPRPLTPPPARVDRTSSSPPFGMRGSTPSPPLLSRSCGSIQSDIISPYLLGPFIANPAAWNNAHNNSRPIHNNNNSSSNNNSNNNNNNNNMDKPMSYSSPPPMANKPENNVCKLIDYRGAKVAAFILEGKALLCIPQAFDLFLKHLVGGLHTVYTKLKRLDIHPVVCNVEQVRILRGLGAIQPGVNRCKLLSCEHFDLLYEDCTNSSARPGRPPKRGPSLPSSHDTLSALKKPRLQNGEYTFDPRIYTGLPERKGMPLFNGFPHNPYPMSALHFMPFAHPMMSHPATMGALPSHIGIHSDGSLIKERTVSDPDILSARPRDDGTHPYIRSAEKPTSAIYIDKDGHRNIDFADDMKPLNLHINHCQDLSPRDKPSLRDDTEEEDDDKELDDLKDEDDSTSLPDIDTKEDAQSKLVADSAQLLSAQLQNADGQGITPFETLLLNIQGLLKVAAENARHHERQCSLEKEELKGHLLREREAREKLEKKLTEGHRIKNLLTRRIKKERKARRRLQECYESSQRGQNLSLDDSSKSSPESDHLSPGLTPERDSHPYDSYPHSEGSSPLTRFPYMPLVGSGTA